MTARRLAVADTRLAAARMLAAGATEGLHTIALHMDADRRSRWARRADEAISLGAGDMRSAIADGRMEAALVAVGADLAWGSWGLGGASPLLAAICESIGIEAVNGRRPLLERLLDRSLVVSMVASLGLPVAGPGVPRSFAVDVLADADGTTWAAGARAVVAVPSGLVLIEESLATADDAPARDAARHLCRALGLVGAATVSFADEGSGGLSFVDLHPWLEPGCSVTEVASGVDLFARHLGIALGRPLRATPPRRARHAAATHLDAVDPDNGYRGAPGSVVSLVPPAGAGVRVDSAVGEGDGVDEGRSLLVTLTAEGATADEARARLHAAVASTIALVENGATDKPALLRLTAGGPPADEDPTLASVALLWAAVEAHDGQHRLEQDRFFATAARGRPTAAPETGHVAEFLVAGAPIRMRTYRLGPRQYRIDAGGSSVDVEAERFGGHEGRLTVHGRQYAVVAHVEGPVHAVEVGGRLHRYRRSDGGTVRAPAPAVVVSVLVATGDQVDAGDPVAVVESMKMESVVRAPVAGRIRHVLAAPNTQVDAGAPIAQIEVPADERTASAGAPPFALVLPPAPSGAGSVPYRCDALFDAIRSYALGYDLDPTGLAGIAGGQQAVCASVEPDDADLLRHEAELLGIFADLCALSRRRPDDDASGAPQEHLFTFLRSLERGPTAVPPAFRTRLVHALARYGVRDLAATPELEAALFWLYRAQLRLERLVPMVTAVLDRRLEERELLAPLVGDDFNAQLDRTIAAADGRYPPLADLARDVRFRYFEEPALELVRTREYARVEEHLDALTDEPYGANRSEHLDALVQCPHPMRARLLSWSRSTVRTDVRATALEASMRRYYRIRSLRHVQVAPVDGMLLATAEYDRDGHVVHLVFTHAPAAEMERVATAATRHMRTVPADRWLVLDMHLWQTDPLAAVDDVAATTRSQLDRLGRLDHLDLPRMHRLDVTLSTDARRARDTAPDQRAYHFTFRPGPQGLAEDTLYRNLHPMLAKRMEIHLLRNFHVTRLDSVEDVYLFHGVAEGNRRDERLFALAEVRDLTPVMTDDGEVTALPALERMLTESLSAIRHIQSHRPSGDRFLGNMVVMFVRPLWDIPLSVWHDVALRLAPATRGLGIDRVVVQVRIPDPVSGTIEEIAIDVSNPGRRGVVLRQCADIPVPEPLTAYDMKVRQTERRGAMYPYELVRMITPATGGEAAFPPGHFTEYDLDADARLVPVDRPSGENTANLVVGTVTNQTAAHPAGMTRVALLGDPSRSLGSLAEAECRRIIAALDLAEEIGVPVEWYALSAGALISMDSGTENMDWISAVLRRIIEFTQAGHELNVVITGINVGAQPYWNAEATMLMHTKGILVMTPESAMVLTGKQALDYSGGVSAEDNLGIGGYERVMGPNGQAQYWAPDVEGACDILFRHYEHSYVAPGERFPRRVPTADPFDRDVCDFPHATVDGVDFRTVGDIFSSETNAERKKPFDIRSVMRAATDQDHAVLERWQRWSSAETAVVWDARIGGIPVCLLGIESRAIARRRFVPADGPAAWTSGTLFPQSSKKTARAVNAASGNRPLVVLANLSGFDGSPESMRQLQLEYGAEIGRAVVNFRGPIVFCVISRYHGGAFVVFSKRLNEDMEIAAVEGSFASVIGGAPAAAVVFTREVDARTKADPRVAALDEAIGRADPQTQKRLGQERAVAWRVVRSEKLGEVAEEFERIHDINRARQVGSVDHIIPAARLRPYIIEALERRMARTDARYASPRV